MNTLDKVACFAQSLRDNNDPFAEEELADFISSQGVDYLLEHLYHAEVEQSFDVSNQPN